MRQMRLWGPAFQPLSPGVQCSDGECCGTQIAIADDTQSHAHKIESDAQCPFRNFLRSNRPNQPAQSTS